MKSLIVYCFDANRKQQIISVLSLTRTGSIIPHSHESLFTLPGRTPLPGVTGTTGHSH